MPHTLNTATYNSEAKVDLTRDVTMASGRSVLLQQIRIGVYRKSGSESMANNNLQAQDVLNRNIRQMASYSVTALISKEMEAESIKKIIPLRAKWS